MEAMAPRGGEQLRLAPHVRACRCDDQVILLDLRRDKYLAVAGKPLGTLARTVQQWPSVPHDDEGTLPSADAGVRRLLSQGLLTYKTIEHQRLPSASVPQPTASLDDEDCAQEAAVTARRSLRFMQSAMTAAASLRFRTLMGAVSAVAARRARLQGEAAPPWTLEGANIAVAVYERLRPLVFTSREKCLFDSLALMQFLAHEGIFPRLVIGVKTKPFRAHAWVQSEETVFNDQHERVRQYTPILVV